jgi:hypothetical protein
MVMSPEIRIVATDEPGWRGVTGAELPSGPRSLADGGGVLPPDAPEDAPVGTATNPARENTSEKKESAAANGDSDSGTGSGEPPAPAATPGNARSTRARNPETNSRSRKVAIRLEAWARDPAGAGAPIGTGAAAGTCRISSIDASGDPGDRLL